MNFGISLSQEVAEIIPTKDVHALTVATLVENKLDPGSFSED